MELLTSIDVMQNSSSFSLTNTVPEPVWQQSRYAVLLSTIVIFVVSLCFVQIMSRLKSMSTSTPVRAKPTIVRESAFRPDMKSADARHLRSQIEGTWELVSYQLALLGPVTISKYPLGADARGTLIYTSNGYMAVQIMKPGAPPFKSPNPHWGSSKENSRAASHYMAYGGRFRIGRVPDDTLVIEHAVDYTLYPNWFGQGQIRLCELEGDKLVLRPYSLPTVLVSECYL